VAAVGSVGLADLAEVEAVVAEQAADSKEE